MINASATQATSFTYRHVPRHHSCPSERLSLSIIPSTGKRSSRESRSASRALMRDIQGVIRLTHPAHVLDTSHTYSHVPPLMRSPHHGNCIPQDTQGGFIHSRLFASTDLYRQHLSIQICFSERSSIIHLQKCNTSSERVRFLFKKTSPKGCPIIAKITTFVFTILAQPA